MSSSEARTADILNGFSLDRREFLRTAALAAGATLAPWVPAARAEVGGEFEIMAWEGYTLEKETAEWRKANNVSMRAAIMANQEDVTAKLAAKPAVRLDLTEYSNGYNSIYRELNVLSKIDVSKIPNYNKDDIYPPFYDGEMWFWDGERWGIPWCWGADTLVYNPELVPFEITSLTDLLRPELKGKLAFFDNPLSTWPQMAKVAGYGDKFPNLTKDELKDCFEKMKPYRDQTRTFAPNVGDLISLFVSGEVAACFCVWSAVPLETAKQNVKTVAFNPKEGPIIWADAWFVPYTSENTDTALAFINQALSPENQASLCKTASANSVSNKAPAVMDEQTRALFDYANFDKTFEGIKIYGQPPRSSEEYAQYSDWLQAWEEFRSGF